jgi:Peptidase family M28/PA domain
MRKTSAALLAGACLAWVVASPRAQTPAQTQGRGQAQGPAPALYKLEDAFLRWPLPAVDQMYGAIDGRHIHQHVADQTAISRRYRDKGHLQFWGRVIGSSADDEDRQWLSDTFKHIGLSDVHVQPFDLAPQWMPQSWELTASGKGETVRLDTAQPAYATTGTTGEGLDLETAYLGTGSEADYIGRDVRGKAVVLFSMPLPGSWRHTATAEGAVRRAQDKGAAAILIAIALPGNIRTQLYPTGTTVPTFSLGMNDGYALRDLIGKQPARLHVKLDVKMEPGRRTGTVWGTLPGATDETVYVLAHRDGWFEAGTDNASGVATMIGLAEYFAKIPKANRRRTIVFLGSSGHHNGANLSGTWLLDHRDEVFAKTALFINCEHTSTIQTYLLGEAIRSANMHTGLLWYAGGPQRPKLQDIAVKAFREFGVVTYAEPERAAPGGEMSRLWPYLPGVQGSDYNVYFHSDHESDDTVPWTGLEAITRAYAKIIDGVNTLDLKDLQRPPEVSTTASRGGR